MWRFGRRSKEKLAEVHPALRRVLEEAIKHCPLDFTIVWGHRDEHHQELAFRTGMSTKQWPDSKHNRFPSMAVDFAPWYGEPPHIRWDEKDDFGVVAGYIARVAQEMGVKITLGALWKMNDLGHIELDL
jgi:peptidoglycan L-alanyl-D-glutamate endopeptidase CwlK